MQDQKEGTPKFKQRMGNILLTIPRKFLAHGVRAHLCGGVCSRVMMAQNNTVTEFLPAITHSHETKPISRPSAMDDGTSSASAATTTTSAVGLFFSGTTRPPVYYHQSSVHLLSKPVPSSFDSFLLLAQGQHAIPVTSKT